MFKILVSLYLILGTHLLLAQKRLLIKNVNFISTSSSILRPAYTLYIQNGKITRITSKPGDTKGYQIIDGQGKYLIPGLMDMHAHFFYEQSDYRHT